MGGAAVKAAQQTQPAVTNTSQTRINHTSVRVRVWGSVWERDREAGRWGESSQEGKGEGGRPWVYSQWCDMFVMFSYWRSSQTACFHFTVWHLFLTVLMDGWTDCQQQTTTDNPTEYRIITSCQESYSFTSLKRNYVRVYTLQLHLCGPLQYKTEWMTSEPKHL